LISSRDGDEGLGTLFFSLTPYRRSVDPIQAGGGVTHNLAPVFL